MDKKVVWTEQSIKDIDAICEYISKDSKYYAYAFADSLFEAGESLKAFSSRGRIVPEMMNENIREIFINEYRLIYNIIDEIVEVFTIIHGRRNAKKILKKIK